MPYKTPDAHRAYNAAYRADPEHREIARARTAEWRKNNRERMARYLEENREQILERQRKYSREDRRLHPDKYRRHEIRKREKHRDAIRERKREYRKRNPEQAQASNARRKSLVRGAPGRGVSLADWRDALFEHAGLCPYCGHREKMTMDHIEPLKGGGQHDPENIVAACYGCNVSKGALPLLVWLAKRKRDQS